MAPSQDNEVVKIPCESHESKSKPRTAGEQQGSTATGQPLARVVECNFSKASNPETQRQAGKATGEATAKPVNNLAVHRSLSQTPMEQTKLGLLCLFPTQQVVVPCFRIADMSRQRAKGKRRALDSSPRQQTSNRQPQAASGSLRQPQAASGSAVQRDQNGASKMATRELSGGQLCQNVAYATSKLQSAGGGGGQIAGM